MKIPKSRSCFLRRQLLFSVYMSQKDKSFQRNDEVFLTEQRLGIYEKENISNYGCSFNGVLSDPYCIADKKRKI